MCNNSCTFFSSFEKSVLSGAKYSNHLKLNLFFDFLKVEFSLNIFEKLSLRYEFETFYLLTDIFNLKICHFAFLCDITKYCLNILFMNAK